MEKSKLKRICGRFSTLNRTMSMLLHELIALSEHDEDEIRIRKEACAHVTASLMAVVFDGEDSELVFKLIREAREKEDLSFLDVMDMNPDFITRDMDNPN